MAASARFRVESTSFPNLLHSASSASPPAACSPAVVAQPEVRNIEFANSKGPPVTNGRPFRLATPPRMADSVSPHRSAADFHGNRKDRSVQFHPF
jgi:hypothetical protein